MSNKEVFCLGARSNNNTTRGSLEVWTCGVPMDKCAEYHVINCLGGVSSYILIMLVQNEAVLRACGEPPLLKTAVFGAAGIKEKWH